MRTSQLPGGLTLLQVNPDSAADLNPESRTYRWLFYRHPDGQWVTQRKMTDAEFDQAWDQAVDGAVLQGTQVRCA